MTKRERIAILAIYISILGFAFVTAMKPVMLSYTNTHSNLQSIYSVNNGKVQLKTLSYESKSKGYSKTVNMLSEVLGISQGDVYLALEGGSKPSEMLASEGIYLSDLSEEYFFDIVGENLIRFRV